MEQAVKEAMAPKRLKTGSGKKPLIITGIILAVLVAAYMGLCAYAVNRPQIWSNTVVLGQDLSGQTVDEAVQTLEAALADMEIGIYLYPDSEEAPPQRADTPDAVVPVADLGVDVDLRALAQDAYAFPLRGTSFFSAGWRFLTHSGVFYGASSSLSVDDTKTQRVADDLAQTLSQEPLDASYTLTEDALQIQVPKDGRQVDSADLFQALSSPYWDVDLSLDISYQVLPAQTMTVQEIYDETSGEVKNATYDAETDTIVPEQMGADFDVAAAQIGPGRGGARRNHLRPGPGGTAHRHRRRSGDAAVPGRAGPGPDQGGRHLRPQIQRAALRRHHQRVRAERRRGVLL